MNFSKQAASSYVATANDRQTLLCNAAASGSASLNTDYGENNYYSFPEQCYSHHLLVISSNDR